LPAKRVVWETLTNKKLLNFATVLKLKGLASEMNTVFDLEPPSKARKETRPCGRATTAPRGSANLLQIKLSGGGVHMSHLLLLRKLWCDDEGQDIAEYAVMLAVILVIVVGTVRLIGSNANNVFSSAASSIQ
jgi:Flp pilus assembly pilin Flp